MKNISLTCKIITPMFAGSAIPGGSELRPPAIKGALRFWWRVLNAGKPWEKLLEEEGKLFGNSDEKVGRSGVQIRLEHKLKAGVPSFGDQGELFKVVSKGKPYQLNILDYLAYGCHEYVQNKGLQYIKECHMPPGEFQLELAFDNAEVQTAVSQALQTLLKYGGIGSRSRNGWGKIAVTNWPAELETSAAPSWENGYPSFTGMSKHATLFTSKSLFATWDKALADVGMVYRDARLGLENKHYYDRRIFVAQPIIVGKDEVSTTFLDRHGKCIFLSVVPEAGKYRGQILMMPYDFLQGITGYSPKREPQTQEIPTKQRDYHSVHEALKSAFYKKLTPATL